MQTLDEAAVVDDLRDIRKEITHPRAALTVLAKLPRACEQISSFSKLHARLGKRKGLAMIARKQRLVVEGVDLRRTTMHEEKDHTLGARTKVRRRQHAAASSCFACEQSRERDRAEACAQIRQRIAARDRLIAVVAEHGCFTVLREAPNPSGGWGNLSFDHDELVGREQGMHKSRQCIGWRHA